MKLNFFKLNYTFQADLDVESLLKVTKIKEGIGFYSNFGIFGDYRFYGKYDKNDNLLLRYNYVQGTKPVVIISKSDNDKSNVEIKYDKLTKGTFVLLLAFILFFLIISVFVKSIEIALFSVAFLIIWIIFINLIFRIHLKKILQEFEEFKR